MDTTLSLERNMLDVSMIEMKKMVETFQALSKQGMVIQKSASNKLLKMVIKLLACNTMGNVGQETNMESMDRELVAP